MAPSVPPPWSASPWDSLHAGPRFELSQIDRSAAPGWAGTKKDAAEHLARLGQEMSELQERLYAQGRTGDRRRVLVVLQGLDTAGKGGIARHVIGMVDPQGVALRSFGRPTEEELSHHFLWRIRRALPPPGRIGVFDRSHYEDVLVTRVEGLVSEDELATRYDEINDFEADLVETGTALVKCALIISHEEQGARLLERLDRPEKNWKYNPADLPTRLRWEDYQEAYQTALTRTSSAPAPWYVVPADHKWYARLAVAEILTETLRRMELTWPGASYDVAAEREKLMATMARPERKSTEARDRA